MHNAQHTSDKCSDNLLEKCEAGALNKWLSGFTAGVSPAGGSPHPSKIIQILLVRLLRHMCVTEVEEPPNFLQILGSKSYTQLMSWLHGFSVIGD